MEVRDFDSLNSFLLEFSQANSDMCNMMFSMGSKQRIIKCNIEYKSYIFAKEIITRYSFVNPRTLKIDVLCDNVDMLSEEVTLRNYPKMNDIMKELLLKIYNGAEAV